MVCSIACERTSVSSPRSLALKLLSISPRANLSRHSAVGVIDAAIFLETPIETIIAVMVSIAAQTSIVKMQILPEAYTLDASVQ